MVEKKNFALNVIEITLTFILMVSFMIPVVLFAYVNINNSVFYELDVFIKNETDAGRLDPQIYAEVEDTFAISQLALNKLDYLFLGCLVSMIGILIFSSYYCKRMNVFEVLFFVTWGIIFILFLTGIFFISGNWLNDTLMSVISGLNLYMPVYSWYMQNGAFLHFGVVLLCAFLNYADFNFLKEEKRKEREVFNDEV